jgi:hypothetical protein
MDFEGISCMLSLAHHYDERVSSGGVTYHARVYGAIDPDGMWGAWIVFFPRGGGRVISTSRETTQSNFDQLRYWASGLTHLYLHGALERALSLQPEEQLVRELERLEREETAAELRAETLEAAADSARADADLAAIARTRTEDHLAAALTGDRPRARKPSRSRRKT